MNIVNKTNTIYHNACICNGEYKQSIIAQKELLHIQRHNGVIKQNFQNVSIQQIKIQNTLTARGSTSKWQ